MKPFKVLDRAKVVDSPYCQIEKQRVVLPDGSEGDWYVSLNRDAVIVIPVLKDGSILLQKQYKHGGGEVVIEFCAGLVDEGEEPIDAAARELQEETGYTAPQFEHLHTVFSNPTGSRMRYHYFLAKDAELTAETNFDAAEQIELLMVPSLDAAKALLMDKNTPTTAGMLGALSLITPPS